MPRRLRWNALALRAGQYHYQMTLERDSGTVILGDRSVSVSATMYGGAPAWLMLETRTGAGIGFTDTLITELSSLRPLHQGSVLGSARLAAEFRGDTVFGVTSAPPGRRSMIGTIPPGSIVTASMLETVLRLLPLQSAWEDSSMTVSVTPATNTVFPTRLAVIGEDRVRVPAGTFDCWVVSVRADPARTLYWVTKSDPIVVRAAMDVPGMSGAAQLIYALTRIGR